MSTAESRTELTARPDHGCFGCGEHNPHGLHLVFARQLDDSVAAEFTPRPYDEGFLGVVHGGIVTTMLDEAMAWAAFANRAWAMTVKLDVRFRRPVEVGVPLRIVGRLVVNRGRLLETAGEIRRAADDALLAEATGTFMRVSEDQARAWETRYLGSPEPAMPGVD
ncbi:MAG: PaaI family thioesterase [Thermomicrobiales bacterium]|nr:PaaI family thioesterase [Thermomicrobiales bacterium]